MHLSLAYQLCLDLMYVLQSISMYLCKECPLPYAHLMITAISVVCIQICPSFAYICLFVYSFCPSCVYSYIHHLYTALSTFYIQLCLLFVYTPMSIMCIHLCPSLFLYARSFKILDGLGLTCSLSDVHICCMPHCQDLSICSWVSNLFQKNLYFIYTRTFQIFLRYACGSILICLGAQRLTFILLIHFSEHYTLIFHNLSDLNIIRKMVSILFMFQKWQLFFLYFTKVYCSTEAVTHKIFKNAI